MFFFLFVIDFRFNLVFGVLLCNECSVRNSMSRKITKWSQSFTQIIAGTCQEIAQKKILINTDRHARQNHFFCLLH